MASIREIIVGCSCGILLSVGLVQTAQVYAETSSVYEGQSGRMVGDAKPPLRPKKVRTMHGDLLRVEGESDLVKNQNEREAPLIVKRDTQKIGRIMPGDRSEGKVLYFSPHTGTMPSAQVTAVVSSK